MRRGGGGLARMPSPLPGANLSIREPSKSWWFTSHLTVRVVSNSDPVHINAFLFENACFFIRFCLPSTLIRP